MPDALPDAFTLPTVSLTSSDKITADAVVVAVRKTNDGPQLVDGAGRVAMDGKLIEALRALGATGRADEVTKVATLGLADVPLIVGIGVGENPSAEGLRRAAGAGIRALTAHRRVHLAIDGPTGALAEGALLGAYAYTPYKSSPPKQTLRTISLTRPAGARVEVRRASALAEAVVLTRDLVNAPPNDLYPQTFADRAASLARERGLEVEVLDERALRRGRYGGILGVGRGSARPPRLVRISYRPAKAKAHLALVGKGITYDSGGLNLKSGPSMNWMKSDMGGAAAVIATVLAAAALKLPVAVTATAPMAENMISGDSYRPSDVLHMYDGSTVEILNTDAEGRLVLADGITRAAKDNPDYLIEISTLTGAQTVALGNRVIGAMGEDGWRDEVTAAANAAGESVWAMPFPDEVRGLLDSTVADISNMPSEPGGPGMLIAGRFLGEFVPDGLPWVHLDIAGPSFNNGGPRDYTPKGATGAGVRAMIAAAELLATR